MSVITRFPPSPTGYLHVGSARTALYSWLYARSTKGKMVLRIEDTDLERSTQEAVDIILEGLNWLGIDWDEGPYFQTKRLDRYQEIVDKLLREGKAYKCYCSRERLDELRAQQMEAKEKPKYDGKCRNLNEDRGGDYVIRFKNPQEGSVCFKDFVRGDIEVNNSELDDLIIVRTDKMPTYNLSCVVDDMDMGITHIVRGEDHVANTPRQINILGALGAKVPEYAHISMILGDDGKRLSKRHGAVSVLSYRDEGYLPQALLNYLVRLGWSHKDQEIFSKEEMIESFSLDGLQKAPAAFNTEKLLWLNQHYMKTLPASEVSLHLRPFLDKENVDINNGPDLGKAIELMAPRANTLVELALRIKCFYQDVEYDAESVAKHINAEVLPAFKDFIAKIEALDSWDKSSLGALLKEVLKQFNLKMPKLAQPIRIAITGGTNSPSIDATLELVGKDVAVDRLKKSIKLFA